MSTFIVVGFKKDMFRASQVLNELVDLEYDWTIDLDDAVAAYRDYNGNLRIDASYQMTTGEGAAVGGLFGSFIGLTLGAIAAPMTAGASVAVAAGVPESCLQIDVAIARGLDYYTGTVYETFLSDLPTIGSVCSGGRYDNLAALFTRQELPGVGASLGLDRLLAAMEELGMIEGVQTPAPVFLPFFESTRRNDYLRLAALIRAAGWGVEFYPEPKKLAQQLKYADRRGHRVALVLGEEEFQAGRCRIKDLKSGNQVEVPLQDDAAELIAALRRMLD